MRFPGAYYLTVEGGANRIYVSSSKNTQETNKRVIFEPFSYGIEEIVGKLKQRGYIRGISEQNCLDMLGIPENRRA